MTRQPGASGTKLKNAAYAVGRLKKSWQLYVLLAPTMIYLILFNYAPMYGLQIAFRDFGAKLGVTGSPWMGLKHFIYFLTSPQFSELIPNTIKISLLSLVWSFPLPILLALMINEIKNRRFLTKGAAGTKSLSFIIRDLAVMSTRTQFSRANTVGVVQIIVGMMLIFVVNLIFRIDVYNIRAKRRGKP